MRSVYQRSVLIVGLLVAACQGSSDEVEDQALLKSFTFSFSGEEFAPHEGQDLVAGMIDNSSKEMLVQQQTSVVEGAFQMDLVGSADPASEYHLVYYADLNGNGACDAPQDDHAWRVAIGKLDGAQSFNDIHNMAFSDVCSFFDGSAAVQAAADSQGAVAVSGQQLLSDDVSAVPGVSSGLPVAGATVFVEGFPEHETKSDANGAFTLQIPNGSAALASSELNAVMWYTATDKIGWDADAVRVGAREGFTVDAGAQMTDLGTVSLAYTKRLAFSVVEGVDRQPATHCWLNLPKYGHNVFFKNLGEGVYRLDYLPAGTYELVVECLPYAAVTKTLTVTSATSPDEVEDLGEIHVGQEG